jgi:Ca-activated chloride channel family protein
LSDENIEAITALGLKYNLLTRYTSFIAVREVVTNPNGSAQDVKQPLPLPMHVSELAVGGAEVGSEPELIWLMVGSLLLATVMILRRRRWFV